MNTDQHVARLESLLARIRRNAVLSRVAASPEPSAQITEIEEADLEIEDTDLTDSEAPPSVPPPSERTDSWTVPATTGMEVEVEVEVNDEPPRSSARSKAVASTMEEALAELDLPQEAQSPESRGGALGLASKADAALQLDDVEELGVRTIHGVPAVAEDYAPTVELEEPFDAELELDDAPPPSTPDRSLVRGDQLAEPADHELSSRPPPASSTSPREAAKIADSVVPPMATAVPTESVLTAHSAAMVALTNSALTAPPPATSIPPATVPAPSLSADATEAWPLESVPSSSEAITKAQPPCHSPPTVALGRELELSEPELEVLRTAAHAVPELEPAAPELVSRRDVDHTARPLRYIRATREFRPKSFVELLDASLSLGSGKP